VSRPNTTPAGAVSTPPPSSAAIATQRAGDTRPAAGDSTAAPAPVVSKPAPERRAPARQQAQPPAAQPPAQREVTPPPAPPAEEPQGFLTIDADPFGTVFIDGVNVGSTPLVHFGVKPGTHTVRIESTGYKTQTIEVQVEAGNTIRKRFTLTPEG
jgi:hypothetical protein